MADCIHVPHTSLLAVPMPSAMNETLQCPFMPSKSPSPFPETDLGHIAGLGNQNKVELMRCQFQT